MSEDFLIKLVRHRILDARALELQGERFTLDGAGFTRVRSPTRVHDFQDEREVTTTVSVGACVPASVQPLPASLRPLPASCVRCRTPLAAGRWPLGSQLGSARPPVRLSPATSRLARSLPHTPGRWPLGSQLARRQTGAAC